MADGNATEMVAATWQTQRQWPTATEMGNGNGNGDRVGDNDGDGDGNRNGDSHCEGDNDRQGCLFMCQQCAVLWQGRHLASTPMDTKESACTSAAKWG